jgi:hypothetical protein
VERLGLHRWGNPLMAVLSAGPGTSVVLRASTRHRGPVPPTDRPAGSELRHERPPHMTVAGRLTAALVQRGLAPRQHSHRSLAAQDGGAAALWSQQSAARATVAECCMAERGSGPRLRAWSRLPGPGPVGRLRYWVMLGPASRRC